MKRLLFFIALAGLAPPAHAQFFVGPASPTPAVVSLGSGLSTALGNPVNSSGGLPLLGGTVAAGDCLVWGANGIQDAGSGCAAGIVTGMGAPVGTSLSNRATDFGVTFNLKTDFGAKCDGATDDTAAIQNWLNKAAANVHLVAPGGTCLFSTPLTIAPVNALTVTGAGSGATIFTYKGASTTSDLLTFGTGTGVGDTHVTLADFSIVSNTVMTGGYALHLHGLFDSAVSNVFADDVNSIASNAGNLCGGFWFDGVGGVNMYGPRAFSKQNCGDGLRVNSAQSGAAQLLLFGGDIGGVIVNSAAEGFVNGFHMAGGIGGLRCDSTNIHNNLAGIRIDNSIVSSGNREFNLGSTCASDTNQNAGLIVNDTIASGGTIDVAGWEASTLTGHGVVIQSWINGDVEMRGNKVYNNCGSGVYVQDTTTHVLFSPATAINNNGNTSLATTCATWQAANAGHGWGVEAAAATTNVMTNGVQPFGNTAGAINANVQGAFAISSPNASLTSLSGSAVFSTYAPVGSNAWDFYQVSGTPGWRIGQLSTGLFGIRDASTSTDILEGAAGGDVTLFRNLDSAYALNLTGTLTIGTLSAPANTGATTETGAGYSAADTYEVGGTSGWQVGQMGAVSGNPFAIRDIGASADALEIQPGSSGVATLYRTLNSAYALNLTGTVTIGSLAATSNTTPVVETGSGYAAWTLYDVSGTSGWRVGQAGNEPGSPFAIRDASTVKDAIQIATGGNVILGTEGTNTITQITGAIGAGGLTATPTASGTCSVKALLGGQAAGSFKASAACSCGSVTLTFAATQPNGYVCDAHDMTTPTDLINQTATSTTSVTFTGTMAANDLVVWKCVGF